MSHETSVRVVNTNPSRFQELAGILAAVYAYYQEGAGLERLVDDFRHIYQRALDQPPCYNEINEITGQSLSSGDRLAGQTAWMLHKIENLHICGVHSMLWHEVDGVHTSPLIDQMASTLGMTSQLTRDDLKTMSGDKKALVDVVGLKGGNAIWIIQSVSERKIAESALSRGGAGATKLFKSRIFNDPVMKGEPVRSLGLASHFMRKAFPDVKVQTLCMVLHPTKPDFELYQVDVAPGSSASMKLEESRIRANSIDFADELSENHEALLTLPAKLNNDLFQGLPPCRAGRTLGILASTAKRQLESERLLVWKESDVAALFKQDFGYIIPRDKMRHDLGDRLACNGFMKKSGSEFSLTMKGVAHYLYCLAKYTTKAKVDAEDVIEACKSQRGRILERYHCI
jgi:hypothetical protein